MLRNVGTNPTRRAIIDLLRRMGADDRGAAGRRRRATGERGEPIADLVVRSSSLHGIDVTPAEVAGGDRRDPDPLPRRRGGVRAEPDPRHRGAAPQGIGPGRRDRRRARGPRRPGHGRRRRDRDRGRPGAHGRGGREPRRPPPGDDLRRRRPHRRGETRRPATRARPTSPTRASSTSWKGCAHDEADRAHRPPGRPFALRRDAAGGLRRARDPGHATSCGTARRRSSPDAIAELRGDDFLGANVTIPHKEKVGRARRSAHRGGPRHRRGQHDHARTGKLVGHNTDVPGFRVALDALVGKQKMPRQAVVLGVRRRRPGGRPRPHHRGLPAGRRLQPPPPPRRGAGQVLRRGAPPTWSCGRCPGTSRSSRRSCAKTQGPGQRHVGGPRRRRDARSRASSSRRDLLVLDLDLQPAARRGSCATPRPPAATSRTAS